MHAAAKAIFAMGFETGHFSVSVNSKVSILYIVFSLLIDHIRPRRPRRAKNACHLMGHSCPHNITEQLLHVHGNAGVNMASTWLGTPKNNTFGC